MEQKVDLGSWSLIDIQDGKNRYIGLSADVEKLPHNVSSGSTALCLDTGSWYIYLKLKDAWYQPWSNSVFASSKAALECGDYTVTAVDVPSESELKSKLVEMIGALESGISVADSDITICDFKAAIDGDGDDIDGTDGSFRCIVTAKDESGGTSIANVTGTIIATKFAGTPNVVCVANAKEIIEDKVLVEDGDYTVTLEDFAGRDSIKAQLAEQINALDGMVETGIEVTKNDISLLDVLYAVSGDADDPNGLDGKFTFTVTVKKGRAIDYTEEIVGVIKANAYDGMTNAEAVAIAKSVIEAGPIAIPQAEAETVSDARIALMDAINSLEGMKATEITVQAIDIKVTNLVNAIVGDIEDGDGTDGSADFTVVLNKGRAGDIATGTATITAVQYDGQSNPEAVAAAKAAIQGAAYSYESTVVNTEDAVRKKVLVTIQDIDAVSGSGVAITEDNITVTGFKSAVNGDGDVPAGTKGSFGFTVALSKGKANDTATVTGGVITPTKYSGQTNAQAVAAAKKIVEGSIVTVAQDKAESKEALTTFLPAIIITFEGLSNTGVTVTKDNVTVSAFTAATAGTVENNKGTNGSFTYTVKLIKGKASDTTKALSGVITATAYVAPKE